MTTSNSTNTQNLEPQPLECDACDTTESVVHSEFHGNKLCPRCLKRRDLYEVGLADFRAKFEPVIREFMTKHRSAGMTEIDVEFICTDTLADVLTEILHPE
jgi:hypothetical protein